MIGLRAGALRLDIKGPFDLVHPEVKVGQVFFLLRQVRGMARPAVIMQMSLQTPAFRLPGFKGGNKGLDAAHPVQVFLPQ